MEELQYPVLIGDIGGTNSRFAIVRDAHSNMELFDSVYTNDFVNVQTAVEHAVLAKTSIIPKSLVMAIAAPIVGAEYKFPNARWNVKPKEVLSHLDMECGQFMNDFPAQALAVLTIDCDKMHKVGGGKQHEYGTRLVMGPGTSFGISTLVHAAGKWVILPAEGACADLGLGTGNNSKRELQIQSHLKRKCERQTIESMICGPGLENLYQAICLAGGVQPKAKTAAQISAEADTNTAADEAVKLFATLLGRVAGNLALGVMATGGVYITGGMANKMLHQIESGNFRHEFEHKAPLHELAKMIPTWFVNRENAALEGLANYTRTPGRFDLSHACVHFSV